MGEIDIGLLQASAPLMMVIDPQGRVLLWNQACSELTGYALDEVKGRCVWELLATDEDADRVRTVYEELLAGTKYPQAEGCLVTKSGERRWIGWCGTSTRRHDGGLEFVTAIGIDRTEAKQAEEALRLSQATLAAIISVASDAIITVDSNQRIVMYNGGAEDIFGWSREEALGKPLEILIPERLREIHRRHFDRFDTEIINARRVTNTDSSLVGLRRDGTEFAADAAITKVQVDGTRLFTVVMRDVSRQQRADRDHRLLAEVGAILATPSDMDDMLSDIAALVTRYLANWCHIDLLDDKGELHQRKVVHADPGKRNIARRLERMPLDRSRPHLAHRVLQARKTVLITQLRHEHLAEAAQSAEYLKILCELDPASYLGIPLLAQGRLLGALVLMRSSPSPRYACEDVYIGEDLAHRIAHSVDSARAYRAAQDAIRARDHVLGVVAHDLRNPISTAVISANALLLECGADDDRRRSRRMAEIIERSLGHATRLIKDLMDVSSIELGQLTIERAPVSPDNMIGETLDQFASLAASASLTIATDLQGMLPYVSADRERLAQILSNLVGNALKFTPAGGEIMIGARAEDCAVHFWVCDTGRGIAADDLPHVFELFWQSRAGERRGVGLGLHITRGLIEAQGGKIWIDSTEGVGTTIHFTMPVAALENAAMASGTESSHVRAPSR